MRAISSGVPILPKEVLAAMLDRDTAKIVAFNVQKPARQEGKAVLAATTHTDLFEDLKPSVHLHKRFGKEIKIDYYCQLAGFHYRSPKVAGVRKIFCLKRGEELCGLVVYSYPPAACFGRRMVLPRMSMRELNEKLSIISRVVVHPKYRTIGLGHKLVRETLEHAGTPYVETVAVMAKYNPFFEKAGLRKIAESQPVKEALKITEVLSKLGFDATYLRSTKYVLRKLASLNAPELSMLKTAFSENKHPRFMKEFSFHDPYGKSKFYKKAVETADLGKLTKLIGICGMLLQTKIYLFWRDLGG